MTSVAGAVDAAGEAGGAAAVGEPVGGPGAPGLPHPHSTATTSAATAVPGAGRRPVAVLGCIVSVPPAVAALVLLPP